MPGREDLRNVLGLSWIYPRTARLWEDPGGSGVAQGSSQFKTGDAAYCMPVVDPFDSELLECLLLYSAQRQLWQPNRSIPRNALS